MKRILGYLWILMLLIGGSVPVFGEITAPVDLTILHTADIHAHLMPFDCASGTAMGGYARIKAYKDSLEARGRKVIMLSSGDVFQGTLFFRFFNGHPDLAFMNATGYEAMALGNHEFDRGQNGLFDVFRLAKFPVMAANLRFTRSKELSQLVVPSCILTVPAGKETLRIGVVGLTDEFLYDDVPRVFLKGIEIEKAETTLRREIPFLQNRGADAVIALAHLGWDRELAVADAFPALSGVLGGHAHVFTDPPIVRKGAFGHQFLAESGEFGRAVARLDVRFSPPAPGTGKRPHLEVLAAGLIPMTSDLPEDPEIKRNVQALWDQVEDKVNVKVGMTTSRLEGDKPIIRQQETNLGNLAADSMLSALPGDVALINGGGIRSSVPAGPITIGDCLNVMPFDNYLTELTMTGATLQKLFGQVHTELRNTAAFGGFLHVSAGFRVEYTPTGAKLSLEGQPIDPDALYKVITNDFLSGGGNGLSAFTEVTASTTSGILCADAFMQKVKALQTVDYQVEGRIDVQMPLAEYRTPEPGFRVPYPQD